VAQLILDIVSRNRLDFDSHLGSRHRDQVSDAAHVRVDLVREC
jgi:hypothetical protein